jgi:MFS family permease
LLAVSILPVWVFFARTLDRLGKGIRTSARDAFLSDKTTKEHKGRVFGFHRSMDTIGAALGPVAALIFLYYFPEQYQVMFLIAFIPGLLAVSLTLILKERKARKAAVGGKGVSFFGYLKYWRVAPVPYRWLVIGLLAFVLFNSSDAFLLLLLKERGYSDTQMIGFYIFYNMVYALFSYPLGIISDRIGQKTIIIIGFVIFSLVYFFYGFAAGTIAFGILFLFYGIYAAATEGISKALISNLVSRDQTATAIGFYNSFASILTLAASSIGGFIWFTFSPQAMFMFSGAGVMLTVGYLVLVMRRI